MMGGHEKAAAERHPNLQVQYWANNLSSTFSWTLYEVPFYFIRKILRQLLLHSQLHPAP